MADNMNTTVHEKLSALASNFWWSWQPDVTNIFRQIDPILWSKEQHNPFKVLRQYDATQLEKRVSDLALHSSINRAYRAWNEYMQDDDTWGAVQGGVLQHRPVAYFSAEFGIHESFPIYSGGLGILAGDHLKSASDLGAPLVGVGLYYDEGYFIQSINKDGWQEESYPSLDKSVLPIREALDPEGKPVVVTVPTRNETIHAKVWEVDVGRVKLFLLDTNIEQNTEEIRDLTARLYGGDQRIRIRQEILLGIGGARALTAMGIDPRVIHMNEGHSAFAPLEFIRLRMQADGLSFDEAMREVARSGVFTTHTPVPAGHDRFDSGLVEEHVGPLADELGLNHEGLMALGRVDPQNHSETFCMTVLAFKLSRKANAVSNLHGVVSRSMWSNLWPWRGEDEIPIGHITNGVHVPTWLAAQMRVLYDRILPPDWYKHTGEPEVWSSFMEVDPAELWETHQSLKNRLIIYARQCAMKQAEGRGASKQQVDKLADILDPKFLTIGFARRFAPYKRADLVLRDFENFAKLVNSTSKPVQFIFAGKAHPRDDNGKVILQKIFKLTQEDRFRGRVLFLDNYDINLARHLVQGVDVWLNNPRRPLEASGTSGQKVVLNGGLNCSILDGWWAEAYDGANGFAIGPGRVHSNVEIQDQRDAENLMTTLLGEVIPMYYERDSDDLPQAWIYRMKRAIRSLGWRFNADRMVMDYVQQTYIPAAGGTSSELF